MQGRKLEFLGGRRREGGGGRAEGAGRPFVAASPVEFKCLDAFAVVSFLLCLRLVLSLSLRFSRATENDYS